jgi:hypothetical protein
MVLVVEIVSGLRCDRFCCQISLKCSATSVNLIILLEMRFAYSFICWHFFISNNGFRFLLIVTENVTQFGYLGTTVTNQNLIPEEIKRRLNSGNACYHSVQNPLSSCLLSKNVEIRIYKTILLPVVLYGCETWSLTLRKENIWIKARWSDWRLKKTT